MPRSVITTTRSGALLLVVLPGCLVAFNDYALGDPLADPSSGGAAGGSASVLPAGGGNTGGSAGKASGGSNGGGPAPNPQLMLDDFEDGDQAILQQQGRNGGWYISNDGRGTQTPRADTTFVPSVLAPARAGSARAAHTYGGPFLGWGALLGAFLVSNGGAKAPYDVSAYRGLRLWVRSGNMVQDPARKVRLSLLTPATVNGGACTVCSDHYGADVPLTASWVQVEVPFGSMQQQGFGRPILTSLDSKQVMGIELLFSTNTAFDLWVDDIALY